MQKYQPYLKLTCVNTGVSQSFCFPETMFITVTAYQNSKVQFCVLSLILRVSTTLLWCCASILTIQITQLKINNNPYARAFRESIPCESTGDGRKGGHYRDREYSNSPSHEHTSGRRRATSRSSPTARLSPRRAGTPSSHTGSKCTSNTSVESGKCL